MTVCRHADIIRLFRTNKFSGVITLWVIIIRQFRISCSFPREITEIAHTYQHLWGFIISILIRWTCTYFRSFLGSRLSVSSMNCFFFTRSHNVMERFYSLYTIGEVETWKYCHIWYVTLARPRVTRIIKTYITHQSAPLKPRCREFKYVLFCTNVVHIRPLVSSHPHR